MSEDINIASIKKYDLPFYILVIIHKFADTHETILRESDVAVINYIRT